MRIEFLKKDGNDRLMLIFAGWSTLPEMYRSLAREGWDLAVVSGIDSLDFDFYQIKDYPTIYLYAWSLGVDAANRIFAYRQNLLTRAIAINGTCKPVDDKEGIPAAIFTGTAEGLDERNLRKFRRRMVGSSDALEILEASLQQPDEIEQLRSELFAVREREDIAKGITWDRAFISNSDAIFPSVNQLAFWKNGREKGWLKGDIIEVEGPHLPDLQYIVNLTIPNPKKIGETFFRALPTYDSAAEAQRRICEHLTGSLRLVLAERQGKFSAPKNILEIGVGTGSFTKSYSSLINPATATFVDLYECERLGLFRGENYVEADAESWISEVPAKRFDLILSASTIQWFVNPELFFRNAARTLNDDGLLICSTFGTGNLHELDSLRPTPIYYRSKEEIEKMLENYFDVVFVETEEITLKFPDVRSLLLHLKKTGVRGSASAGKNLSEISNLLTKDKNGCYTLTYCPIYIIASKSKKL